MVGIDSLIVQMGKIHHGDLNALDGWLESNPSLFKWGRSTSKRLTDT